MALFAFDGTWNTAKDGDDPQSRNTNVVRFYRAYTARSATDDLYIAGVGTRLEVVGKVVGGVFGAGSHVRVDEAYAHLCKTWADGDHVIDVIGFSRGAAITLDFCHRIQEHGIRAPGSDTVIEPAPHIRFLGLWDVVAAFGLANLGAVDFNIGHHLTLPGSQLSYCFHALALDERRPSFLPTRLPGAHEVWFRGAHSDIGGGNGNRGLNDISMRWMMSKAMAAGLPIAADDIAALHPDPATPPHLRHELPVPVRLISAVDRGHFTVAPAADLANLPPTCAIETPADEQTAVPLGAATLDVMPLAVRRRIAALWEAAESAGADLHFPLDGVKDALLTLFQGRVPLIANDGDLTRARQATVRLVALMVAGARERGFHTLTEFFLTEALFKLRPRWPFAD